MNNHFKHLIARQDGWVIPKGEGTNPYRDVRVAVVSGRPMELSIADPDDVMLMVSSGDSNDQFSVDAKYIAHWECSACQHVWKARARDLDGLGDYRLFVRLALVPPQVQEMREAGGETLEPPLLAHIDDVPAVQEHFADQSSW